MPVKKAALAQPNALLKRARQGRGWSQQEVADMIGAPQAFMVTRWENGTAFPGPGYRQKLCLLFEKSPQELGLLKEPSVPPPADPYAPVHDTAIPLRVLHTRSLIGRGQVLSQLQQELCGTDGVKRLAIDGLPGVGKTTLAAALATSPTIQEYFTDGVLWAGLGPHPNVQAHLHRWGKVLGLPEAENITPGNVEALGEALRRALWNRQMLLIIDDAWNIEDALACTLGGSSCAYLLTTRIPEVATRFAGEQSLHLSELSEQEGIRLLSQITPTVQETEPEMVRSLVQAVGGLPLALTLVGNYLLLQARHQQRRRVQAALTQLQQAEERLYLTQPQAGIERDPRLPVGAPLTLQAVIGLSEAILEEEERKALSALALFPAKPASFSEEAALVVSAANPEVLDRLVDVGLLESCGIDRYTLHQTIADYARLQPCPDQRTEQRLVVYVTTYVEEHREKCAALEQEFALILVALELAPRVGCQAEFVHCVSLLCSFLRMEGSLALMERLLQQAYKIEKDQCGHKQLAIWHELAVLQRDQGHYEHAEMLLEEGALLAREQGDTAALFWMLSRRGTVVAECGEYARAEGYFLEALVQARELTDPHLIATLFSTLGFVPIVPGNVVQAETYIGESLALRQQPDGEKNSIPALIAITNLGWVLGKQGKFAEAEKCFEEAVKLARSTHNYEILANTQLQFGQTLLYRDDYPQAKAYLQEAILLGRRVCRIRSEGPALVALAFVALKERDIKQADVYLRDAYFLIQQIGNGAEYICPYMMAKGQKEIYQEQYVQARATLQEGLEVARQFEHVEYISSTLLMLGTVVLWQGELEDACVLLQEGLDRARQMNLPWLLGIGLIQWGRYHLLRHEYEEAHACYQEMLTNISPSYREFIACAYEGLARVAAVQGQFEQAAEQGQIALDLFEAIGHGRARDVRAWLLVLLEHKIEVNQG
ncbi:MAG TPA: tetratricopeptide repeat protein [Ktedonosporobacter sp.]|nr:tetratricopeptide repeat protein [Ktedonosporobacter sp.]